MNNLKKSNYAVIAITAVIFVLLLMVSVSEVHAVSNPRTNAKGITTWDCIYFGHYPQTSNNAGGYNDDPIKWRVLAVNGNDALLLADKNIDSMPYSEDDDDCLWHVSTIRSWLNGYDASTNQKRIDYTDNNFLKSAFTNEEQNAIKTTEVVTDKYTDWHFNWTDIDEQNKDEGDK